MSKEEHLVPILAFALPISASRRRTQHVEAHSLGQRPALANGHLVTVLHTECRADVCSEVLVSLLITGVLGDEVEVFAADDESAVHLGRNDGAGKDTATDGDLASEWALAVCEMIESLAAVLLLRFLCPVHEALCKIDLVVASSFFPSTQDSRFFFPTPRVPHTSPK
jgi:hypothetical protein